MPVCELTIGDIVHDREDDDPDDAIVVNTPPVPADEWESPGLDGETVADDNPDYPADAPVAITVYRHHLEEYDSDWLDQDDPDPISIRQLREDNILTYSFPAPRLETVDKTASNSQGKDSTDGEAATEAPTPDSNSQTTSGSAETAEKPTPSDTTNSSPDESTGPDSISPATQALKERLEDGGMTVEIEPDGKTLRAEKLGEYYRVQPGKIVEGDGALRDRLESVVNEFDPATASMDTD